jgi:hypothetical protein
MGGPPLTREIRTSAEVADMIVSTGAPVPAVQTVPGTGADMAALTGVLPGPDGPLPLLILDQQPELTVRSGPADRANPSFSALLGMGLTLVTTISEQFAQAMDGQAGALAYAQALSHARVASPGPWVRTRWGTGRGPGRSQPLGRAALP